MNRDFARSRGAQTVEQLLAYSQIEAVLAAYCQGVDRQDWDSVVSCYHDNAIDDHGQFRGTAVELVEWLKPNHKFVKTSMHVLSNVSIHIADDDPLLARVESYFSSNKMVTSAKNDTFFKDSDMGSDQELRRTVAGRYIDTFENRESMGWRIAHREVVVEWVRLEPNENYLPVDQSSDRARRDDSDPLYSPLHLELR